MADPRFFRKPASCTLGELAQRFGATLAAEKDADCVVEDIAPLEAAGASDLSFFDNPKYLDAFLQSRARACIVKPVHAAKAPPGMALLLTPTPYYTYAQIAQFFYPETAFEPVISPHAHIDASAKIGAGCRVDAGAVIGAGCVIGEKNWIGANTVLHDGVQIGADCRIGANTTLSHCILGARVILHRGVHIGQDGFGFAPGPRGIAKVPQLGRVLIGDDVEIGSGTCIDRGSGHDTIIGDACKIDNLVQIGHNVVLGRGVMLAGQVGVAGSCTIGDYAMLGGQVGLAGHLHIGKGAKLAAQAGVMRDIAAGEAVAGSPAVPIRQLHRQNTILAQLATRTHEKNAHDES